MEDSASIEDSSADDLKVPKNKSDIKTMSESEEDVNDIGSGSYAFKDSPITTIKFAGESLLAAASFLN